ncbi:MAG TPA: hypothetical protein PLX35_13845 [Cyclobacteriaceae bacterium]|nr:hypothetical protein [Cyclobacteriaceae bacterium]
MEKASQDELLLSYLEGTLDELRLQALKTALESSPILRQRLAHLRMVHEVLSRQQLEIPATNFVARVMSNLHKRQSSISLSPRNGLMLVLGTTIAIGMLLMVMQAGLFNNMNMIDAVPVPQPGPSQKYIPSIPPISINFKLVVNILMGLNLALALVVLDRTILKPYFQKRAGAGL